MLPPHDLTNDIFDQAVECGGYHVLRRSMCGSQSNEVTKRTKDYFVETSRLSNQETSITRDTE